MMNFEWDASKAALNLQKHGVAFEDAQNVFYDLLRIERYDDRDDYCEDRWVTVGLVHYRLLSVAYTVRNETIRIISARKADSDEQKQYRAAND